MSKKKSVLRNVEHFDEICFHDHIMMDALAKHLLGLAPYGMIDIGEVLETYCQLKSADEELWFKEWVKRGDFLLNSAVKKEHENHI